MPDPLCFPIKAAGLRFFPSPEGRICQFPSVLPCCMHRSFLWHWDRYHCLTALSHFRLCRCGCPQKRNGFFLTSDHGLTVFVYLPSARHGASGARQSTPAAAAAVAASFFLLRFKQAPSGRRCSRGHFSVYTKSDPVQKNLRNVPFSIAIFLRNSIFYMVKTCENG